MSQDVCGCHSWMMGVPGIEWQRPGMLLNSPELTLDGPTTEKAPPCVHSAEVRKPH